MRPLMLSATLWLLYSCTEIIISLRCIIIFFKFQYNVGYSIATNVADNKWSVRHSQCALTIKPLNKNEEMNEKQNE